MCIQQAKASPLSACAVGSPVARQAAGRFDAIIYDLDGTLIDTLADLANSANQVLRNLGFPEHPESAYCYYVGDGVTELMRRCLPEAHRETDALIERAVKAMAETYAERWHEATRIYPGITDLVVRAKAAGLPQAVLSNKPDHFTQLMTAHYFPDKPFVHVRGQRPGTARKPDPAGALAIASDLGLPPARILYLGDTATDMQTAVSAGMFAVGACWGFRPREELRANGAHVLAEHPRDVIALLESAS